MNDYVKNLKSQVSQNSHWFSLPTPVRHVFEQFPLVTESENRLPQRNRRQHTKHVLYIFSRSHDDSKLNLSHNPSCLKWQVYLIVKGIDFKVQSSNNHASPSGALPFLLPVHTKSGSRLEPIASNKLLKWLQGQNRSISELDKTEELYTSLIDYNIRNSWLLHLYLDKFNSVTVAKNLYITPCSSNRFVQKAIAYQLEKAAREELLKTMSIIDHGQIYESADNAFKALSIKLGNQSFFFSEDSPELFDASLFAYTHLILDTSLGWRSKTLQNLLHQYSNLVDHRNRMLEYCTTLS